ncbi:MAG: MaoC family dehydratase, partial [Candidatus Dormibacteraeota bacterium]|nr:MaoC family dehydratase [Candidatus Dormibacteraeota bacterium]
TFHGDTIYAQTTVLDKKESSSKPDRGIVYVETRGHNQRGERVCIYRRRVMVPKQDHYPDLQPGDLTPEQSREQGLLPEGTPGA